MDILSLVIAGLNKEETRFFKLYTSRTGTEGSRKDILLFDYIKKSGGKYQEDKIFKTLYGNEKDKNSFYRLKNRLLNDLNKSLALQHYDDDHTVYLFHQLSLIRFFFTRNNYKVAFHYTKKAERNALDAEHYELLDIIYGEFIRLSYEIVSIDPELYIRKRKENREKINNLREIDDVLAAVSYRTKITQNFSPKENPILRLLQKTVDDFSQNTDIQKSPKLRFKIYNSVSQILLQRRDYKTLEEYLMTAYKDFSNEALFTKDNHDVKLQMLAYLVNTLFKNEKYKLSLEYAAKLKEAMEAYNHLHYDKYLFFYYNSLVINYSALDIDKAISILEELQDNERFKKTPFYEVFVYLNLALLWFDKHHYRNAIRNLSKLYQLDGYKNADRALKFKIAIAELIIRYELNDPDYFEHRMKEVEKEYKALLRSKENRREKELIGILKLMAASAVLKKDKPLMKKINGFMETGQTSPSVDTEIIKYNVWLAGKTA